MSTINITTPCPTCGKCPTCGSGGYRPWWGVTYPNHGWGQGWTWPNITYTTASTTQYPGIYQQSCACNNVDCEHKKQP